MGELSAIDQERFGIATAKAMVNSVADADRAIDDARGLGARMLIVRCPASELHAAQRLEERGCHIMDVLVYYSRDLTKRPLPEDVSEIGMYNATPKDADAVEAVARDSFKGYIGHYHADPRLDRAACDEVYTSWARRSVLSREVADNVLVAHEGGEVRGFATLRLNSPEEGEGVLFGVAPSSQGRGLYRAFMIRGMHWCIVKGATRMVVSTQVTNIAVQKVWTRLGFEPQKSYLTFHRWFDD